MKKTAKIILRILWIAPVAVVALALLAIVALYLPPVQDYAREYALGEIKKSTGMDIKAITLRLRPPLRLELGGVSVVEASGDTLATLGHARVRLLLLPLLSGSAEIDAADIENVYYRLGTPDSAIYLTARIDTLSLADASYSFRRSVIDARGKLLVAGAGINLLINDSVASAPDTSSSALSLLILARDIEMRRIAYSMSMTPVIDSLGAWIPSARLTGGRVDMASHTIHARSLEIDSVAATYLTPPAPAIARADTVAPDTAVSEPWTVTADRVGLTARRATYAVAGATPLPGLDMDYLSVSDVDIRIDSLYNRATALRVPLRRLLATERCGLSLNASGLFTLAPDEMRAEGFRISTGRSIMSLDAVMGMGDTVASPSSPLMIDARAEIAPSDIALCFPALAPMAGAIDPTPLRLVARASGTMGRLTVDTLSAAIPSVAYIKASGAVSSPLDFNAMSGHMRLDGAIERGASRLKGLLLDRATAARVNIPPTRLRGDIDYRPGLVDGTLAAVTGAGRMSLDARWAMTAESYRAALVLDRFPVRSEEVV